LLLRQLIRLRALPPKNASRPKKERGRGGGEASRAVTGESQACRMGLFSNQKSQFG
jgi:hypothetical protein